MTSAIATQHETFVHQTLDSGIEYAVDVLPQRQTVALTFRMLVGVANDPPELTGLSSLVEQTLSKGTKNYDGQALADAFDRLGARWSTASGRQTTIARVLCLPEFIHDVIPLVAEMFCRPAFPDDACNVAIELARQDLRRMQDEPFDLLRLLMAELTLGPVFGRYVGGTEQSLGHITPDHIRDHWKQHYAAGRMQVTAAGPIDTDALANTINEAFTNFGSAEPVGRITLDHDITPTRRHQHKELEQQYIGLALPGLPRTDPGFPIEQVLVGVLSGGMSGRLFTEVREKQGLVYWVGAWHEQPRGKGVLQLGASTTPQRCDQTYETLIRELTRISDDLTDVEVTRARDGLIAHYETEDDLTRARAGSLAEDLFHFGRPIGRQARIAALRAVDLPQVRDYAAQLRLDQICTGTVGPVNLAPANE